MEIISLVAIILGVIGGFKLMGNAMLMLGFNFNIDKGLLPFAAFGIVFIIIVVVVSLLGKLIKSIFDKSAFGLADDILGGVFGLIKAIFLVSVMLWIISSVGHDPLKNLTANSHLYPLISDFAPYVTSLVGLVIPSLGKIFD